ncbi:MAG: aminotransferase class I and II [Chloroflexi bacterium]|nr:MAG: aminotransferase class I and II [Chloroflexota bacterium]
MRTVQAERYVTPLRQGGSLPAVVEADDGEQYVMKFAGAGQGRKALIAELLAGEIGRALGLTVPEIVLIRMDEHFGRSEPDPEIQDLLRGSVGLNLGMAYLPGALEYSALLKFPLSPEQAAQIVWFDALVTNVDRTPRNVNLLIWEQQLWLIDHGASLYFHHNWPGYVERAANPFPMSRQHVLLPRAGDLLVADQQAKATLAGLDWAGLVAAIPDAWLGGEAIFADIAAQRQGYVGYLTARLAASAVFAQEAEKGRKANG